MRTLSRNVKFPQDIKSLITIWKFSQVWRPVPPSNRKLITKFRCFLWFFCLLHCLHNVPCFLRFDIYANQTPIKKSIIDSYTHSWSIYSFESSINLYYHLAYPIRIHIGISHPFLCKQEGWDQQFDLSSVEIVGPCLGERILQVRN